MNISALARHDHQDLKRLFGELSDPATRVLAAPAVLALLTAHSRAEESEVYPAVCARRRAYSRRPRTARKNVPRLMHWSPNL